MKMRHSIMQLTIHGLLAALLMLSAAVPTGAAVSPAVTAAFDCNARSFLESLWQDLQGRAISPGERAFFLNFLDRGGSRTQVALAVINSLEYRAKLVQSFYQQFLGRAAGPPELMAFVTALQRGATVEHVIAALLGSNEYFERSGGGTNAGFLEQLYRDALGRPIDEAGLSNCTNLLNRGFTRAQVAEIIVTSTEYRAKQVQSFFQTLLDRAAREDELTALAGLWQQGAPRGMIIAQIAGSAEYCELATRVPRSRQ